MSAVWDADGNRIPVTILQISRAQVTAVKTPSKDGYWAVQVGIGYRKPENVTKAMLGHFAAARVAPKVKVGEFRVKDESGVLPVGTDLGQELIADVFRFRDYG
jgi:large subunit ribosomal protein L3